MMVHLSWQVRLTRLDPKIQGPSQTLERVVEGESSPVSPNALMTVPHVYTPFTSAHVSLNSDDSGYHAQLSIPKLMLSYSGACLSSLLISKTSTRRAGDLLAGQRKQPRSNRPSQALIPLHALFHSRMCSYPSAPPSYEDTTAAVQTNEPCTREVAQKVVRTCSVA
jgi:hypothetical protein